MPQAAVAEPRKLAENGSVSNKMGPGPTIGASHVRKRLSAAAVQVVVSLPISVQWFPKYRLQPRCSAFAVDSDSVVFSSRVPGDVRPAGQDRTTPDFVRP